MVSIIVGKEMVCIFNSDAKKGGDGSTAVWATLYEAGRGMMGKGHFTL